MYLLKFCFNRDQISSGVDNKIYFRSVFGPPEMDLARTKLEFFFYQIEDEILKYMPEIGRTNQIAKQSEDIVP